MNPSSLWWSSVIPPTHSVGFAYRENATHKYTAAETCVYIELSQAIAIRYKSCQNRYYLVFLRLFLLRLTSCVRGGWAAIGGRGACCCWCWEEWPCCDNKEWCCWRYSWHDLATTCLNILTMWSIFWCYKTPSWITPDWSYLIIWSVRIWV